MRPLKYGGCCGYATGQVVDHDGRLWQAIRRTLKGEVPGHSDAWELIGFAPTRTQQARQIDPRIGDGA